MPRVKHKPKPEDRKMVKAMVGVGVPTDQVATVLGIARSTMYLYYKNELDTAHTFANAKVAECLFKKAIGGNVTAQIFWCKTRMGWKEHDSMDINVNISLLDSLRDANARREKRIGQADGLLLDEASRVC